MNRQVVLTLDGSTRVCSVALLLWADREKATVPNCQGAACRLWEIVGRESITDARGQARSLLPMIERLLHSAGLEPGDLGAVVAGVGPGTFTGVRVAVATARAISLALGIPVLGVSSLAALASQAALAAEEEGLTVGCLVPVIDAHRKQVFYAVYEKAIQERGQQRFGVTWRAKVPYAVCDIANLGQVVPEEALVVTEDARLAVGLPHGAILRLWPLAAEYLLEGQHLLAEGRESLLQAVLAQTLVGRAGEGSPLLVRKPGDPGTAESVVPIYVRPPDADVHITKMKDPWASDSTGSGGSAGSSEPSLQ